MSEVKRHGKPGKRRQDQQPQASPVTRQKDETQPAQEWGERIATGKAIARGGKSKGHVPGATEQRP